MANDTSHYDASNYLMAGTSAADRALWKSMGGVENAFRTVQVRGSMLKTLLATALPVVVGFLPHATRSQAISPMPALKNARIKWIAQLLEIHARTKPPPAPPASYAPVSTGPAVPDPPASFILVTEDTAPTTPPPTRAEEAEEDDLSSFLVVTEDPVPDYQPDVSVVACTLRERAERDLGSLAVRMAAGTYTGRLTKKNPVPRYYTYALTDPRSYRGTVPTYDQFVRAIMYVGKGTKERDLHYYDEADTAFDLDRQPNPKIAWIKAAWQAGRGYVPSRCVSGIDELTAFAYEHVLIQFLVGKETSGGIGKHIWMQGGNCLCHNHPPVNSPAHTCRCTANQVGGTDVLGAELQWTLQDMHALAREILLSTYYCLVLSRGFHHELRRPQSYQ